MSLAAWSQSGPTRTCLICTSQDTKCRYDGPGCLSGPDDPNEIKTRLGLPDAHDVADEGGGLAGGLADPDAGLFQGFLLGLGGAGGSGDDRAGVAHRLAFGRGEPGHVAHDRLGHVLLDVGPGALLG